MWKISPEVENSSFAPFTYKSADLYKNDIRVKVEQKHLVSLSPKPCRILIPICVIWPWWRLWDSKSGFIRFAGQHVWRWNLPSLIKTLHTCLLCCVVLCFVMLHSLFFLLLYYILLCCVLLCCIILCCFVCLVFLFSCVV